jgi:hypothetical protein
MKESRHNHHVSSLDWLRDLSIMRLLKLLETRTALIILPEPIRHLIAQMARIGDIVILGGRTKQGSTEAVYMFSLTSREWIKLASLPSPRAWPIVGVLDSIGSIVLQGGSPNTDPNSMYVLKTSPVGNITDGLTCKSPQPLDWFKEPMSVSSETTSVDRQQILLNRTGVASCVANQRIYRTSGHVHRFDFEILGKSTHVWTPFKPLKQLNEHSPLSDENSSLEVLSEDEKQIQVDEHEQERKQKQRQKHRETVTGSWSMIHKTLPHDPSDSMQKGDCRILVHVPIDNAIFLLDVGMGLPVERLCLNTNTWTTCKPGLRLFRGGGSRAVVHSGRTIMIAGGCDDRGSELSRVEEWDMSSGTESSSLCDWRLPVAASEFALELIDETWLVFVGGRTGKTSEISAHAWMMDMTDPHHTWIRIPSMPIACYGMASVVIP